MYERAARIMSAEYLQVSYAPSDLRGRGAWKMLGPSADPTGLRGSQRLGCGSLVARNRKASELVAAPRPTFSVSSRRAAEAFLALGASSGCRSLPSTSRRWQTLSRRRGTRSRVSDGRWVNRFIASTSPNMNIHPWGKELCNGCMWKRLGGVQKRCFIRKLARSRLSSPDDLVSPHSARLVRFFLIPASRHPGCWQKLSRKRPPSRQPGRRLAPVEIRKMELLLSTWPSLTMETVPAPACEFKVFVVDFPP